MNADFDENVDASIGVRDTLEKLAEKAQSNLLDEDNAPSNLKWKCSTNTEEMTRVLRNYGYETTHVIGILAGDQDMYDVERVFVMGDQAEEHGHGPFPKPSEEYLVDTWTVDSNVVREKYSDVGVIHEWAEVVVQGQRWIVEPYAEMRGNHEYNVVATPVKPIDYLYIEGQELDTPPSQRWDQSYL